jgi:hypothetical protein
MKEKRQNEIEEMATEGVEEKPFLRADSPVAARIPAPGTRRGVSTVAGFTGVDVRTLARCRATTSCQP